MGVTNISKQWACLLIQEYDNAGLQNLPENTVQASTGDHYSPGHSPARSPAHSPDHSPAGSTGDTLLVMFYLS